MKKICFVVILALSNIVAWYYLVKLSLWAVATFNPITIIVLAIILYSLQILAFCFIIYKIFSL